MSLLALGLGSALMFWSITTIYFGNFHVGVEKKGGHILTPQTSPLGFWLPTGAAAAVGLAVIFTAIFSIVRVGKADTTTQPAGVTK